MTVISFLLDTWPVMAGLKGENCAAGEMDTLWEKLACNGVRLSMSVINAGEAYYTVTSLKDEGYASLILDDLVARGLKILSVPDSLVFAAARLKAKTRSRTAILSPPRLRLVAVSL